MPKPMYVWSGSAWVSVAAEVESLATYATQSYADNTPAMRMIVPTSVTVGSGSGSVATQGTVSFSGASSVSLNNCFNSTYDNYKVILKLSATTADSTVYIKMRSSGTDSSVNYNWGLYGVISVATSVVNGAAAATTGWFGLDTDTGATAKPVFTEMTLLNPKIAEPTSMIGQLASFTNGGLPVGLNFWGQHTSSTSYDGLTFVPTAGNISGTIQVYGYKIG